MPDHSALFFVGAALLYLVAGAVVGGLALWAVCRFGNYQLDRHQAESEGAKVIGFAIIIWPAALACLSIALVMHWIAIAAIAVASRLLGDRDA